MNIVCFSVHNHLLTVKPKRMVICLPNIHGVSTCRTVSNHPFSTMPLSDVPFRLSHSTAFAFLCHSELPIFSGFWFLDFPLDILYTIGWLLSIPSAINASSIRIFCLFVLMSCVSYQQLHLPLSSRGTVRAFSPRCQTYLAHS